MFSSSADALANLFHAAARLEGAYSWEELADVLELCVEPAVKPEEPTPDPRPPVETPGPEPWQVEQIERELEPPGYEFEVEHIAADSEREPAVGMTVDAQPLDADSDEQPLERKTLFARGLIRDIVRRTLSTPVRSREPDVARIVAMMARGEPMLRIPRGRRPSLRNGVQVVCDIGDSMAPYVDDQAQLVRFMRDLLGAEFVEEIRSVGVPNLCWGARRKQLYVPPRAESPVLILSDLGIGDPPFATTRTSTEEWCEFVRGLRRAGNPVVAYVPYRRKRWPAAMRGLAEIHHWDRPVPELAPPTVSRVAPRSDEERAVGQLIESERSARPGVIELARRVALAARI